MMSLAAGSIREAFDQRPPAADDSDFEPMHVWRIRRIPRAGVRAALADRMEEIAKLRALDPCALYGDGDNTAGQALTVDGLTSFLACAPTGPAI